VLLVAAAGCICFASAAQPETSKAAKHGIVNVLVYSTYAQQPPRRFEIEIMGEAGKPQFRKVVRSAGEVELPYGTYIVRGRAGLHHPFERRLVVQSPKLLFLVGFSFVDQGESSIYQTPLSGRVQNSPAGKGRLWVRVLSVFEPFSGEAEVDANGRFELDAVPYGDYMVLVFRDFTVLKIQRFTKTVREEEAVVDLAEK